MKNMNLFILFFSILAAGCLQTRNDIKETEATQNFQNQLSIMQKNSADYSTRVEESIENQRHLNGKIESIENRVLKLEGVEGDKATAEKQQVEVLTEKVNLLQEALTKMENDIHALQAEVSSKKSKSSDVVEGSGLAKNEPHKELYDEAEEHFKEKKWKEAILKYDEYRNKTGTKGKYSSDAAYKTGVCFQELGMNDDAKTFYQEVLNKFAKSESARKAQIRLKGLNAKNK